MTTWTALLVVAPAVPAAPPLVDSTVIVALIGMVSAIILLLLGARLNRKETAPSPPAASGESLGQHDIDVAKDIGAIESKLRRDHDRLNQLDITKRDHEERIRGIEHKLGITPDPNRLTTGGNQ